MRFGVDLPGLSQPLLLAGGQFDPESLHDRGRDLVLHGEHVLQNPVVPLGPHVRTIGDIDELSRDADAVSRLPNASLED